MTTPLRAQEQLVALLTRAQVVLEDMGSDFSGLRELRWATRQNIEETLRTFQTHVNAVTGRIEKRKRD